MTEDWDKIPRPRAHLEAPLDFRADGSCPLRVFRLRSVWFGLARLEQKVVYRDGSVVWRRYPSWMWPIILGVSQESAHE